MDSEETESKAEKIADLIKWEEYYFKRYEKTGRDFYKQKMIDIKDQLKSLGFVDPKFGEQKRWEPTHSTYDPIKEDAVLSKLPEHLAIDRLKKNYVQSQRDNNILRVLVEDLKLTNERLLSNNGQLIKERDKANQVARRLEQERLNKDVRHNICGALSKPEELKSDNRNVEKLNEEYQKQILHNRAKNIPSPQSFEKYKPDGR